MRSNPLSLRGLDHVAIRVRDLDTSVRFYCTVLKFEVAARNADAGIVHLRAGKQFVDLVSLEGRMGKVGGVSPTVEARNMHHLCMSYEPYDFGTLVAYLDEQRVEHSSKPQSNLGAEGEGLSVYITDPDENLIEIKSYASQSDAA